MSGGGEPVSAIFSPDGRRLATWAWDNVLRVWDVATGAPVAALEGHQDGISSAAFSADGTRIVSGSYDRTARIWNLGAGGETTVLAGHDGEVNGVAFAPDGLRVASAGSDKVVRVWDVTGHPLATLTGHSRSVTTVAFAPNGRELVSGSEDRTIRLWDADTFFARGILNGHTDTITSVAFSADGRQIVSGSADQTLRFWDPAAARSESIIAVTGFPVRQVAIGDSRLAFARRDGVPVLNLSTMSPPLICSPGSYLPGNIVFTPDGTRLVFTFQRPLQRISIGVTDPSNCNSLAVLSSWPDGSVGELAMSPGGNRLAVGNTEGVLEAWDLAAGRRVWQTDKAGKVRALAYSQDGTGIIATADRDVRVWDADSHALIRTMTGHEANVTALSVSPDGRWIASASEDGSVRLWTASTGQPVATLRGHNATVFAVAFSPDGLRLVSGGGDAAVRFWDVATHEPTLVLRGHQERVLSIAFTPDGNGIVSGSGDGTVRMWQSRPLHDADAALLVERLRSTLRLTGDVVGRVRTDSTLDPRVRAAALAMAEARGDDPSFLDRESWRAVKTPGLAPGAYEVALRRAQLANEAAPWNPDFIHTLGAAYYRLKQYENSLSTMTRATGLRPVPDVTRLLGHRDVAKDLVFIAMAHHQLGHRDEARTALDLGRKLVAHEPPRNSSSADTELYALYDEATALIGQ